LEAVSEERLAEMGEQLRKWQEAALDRLMSGNDGPVPPSPVFTAEEISAWGEAFAANIEERMASAFGGREAYDRQKVQAQAIYQAQVEADRSVALVRTSVVEEHLRLAIERHFPGLATDPKVIDRIFDPMKNGPLSTFTARVDVAFALGIIGKGALTALKKIAEIRNLFAHRLEINAFDHPEIVKLVGKLTYIDFAITGPDDEGIIHVWQRNPNNEVRCGLGYRAVDNPLSQRGKFERTCEFLQRALREAHPALSHPDLHEGDTS
jgi:DNA-binding MltR family transcriptional regulator